MKVELHAPDWTLPETVHNVLNYQFDDDYRTLWLYDVKDVNQKVTPIAVIVLDHWAMVKFI